MGDARRCREHGTTLLLVPAATLVLIILGAIAVDLSTIHLARRELVRVVAHAADDGASMVDTDHLRRTGGVRLDPAAADRVARAQIFAAELPGRLIGRPTVELGTEPTSIEVTATLEVDHLFAAAIPGAPDHQRITVRSQGRLLLVEPAGAP